MHDQSDAQKRGRPPVPIKLSEQVKVSLSKDQLEALRQAADTDGKRVAAWARQVILKELGIADD